MSRDTCVRWEKHEPITMNEVATPTYVDKANPYLTTGIWTSRINKHEVMSEHGAKKREACSQDKRYYWGNHSIHLSLIHI